MVAGVISVASALAGTSAVLADNAMNIPVIPQQDPAWGGTPLGAHRTDTIASSGCAISAVTMLLRYYGMNTNPNAINAWLTPNGGYAYWDQLVWDAVTRYSGGRIVFSGWLGPDLTVIHGELDAAQPVVAEVSLYGNQHFVLITGYTSQDGLLIDDPWFGDSVRFSDRYGDPATGIVSIRIFHPHDSKATVESDRLSRIATG
jgi:uncharacterized protein YvpB